MCNLCISWLLIPGLIKVSWNVFESNVLQRSGTHRVSSFTFFSELHSNILSGQVEMGFYRLWRTVAILVLCEWFGVIRACWHGSCYICCWTCECTDNTQQPLYLRDNIFPQDCHPDLQDDVRSYFLNVYARIINWPHPVQLIAYWETEMPPSRRQRIVEQVNVIMNVSHLVYLLTYPPHDWCVLFEANTLECRCICLYLATCPNHSC